LLNGAICKRLVAFNGKDAVDVMRLNPISKFVSYSTFPIILRFTSIAPLEESNENEEIYN
jgi:hypothetical protein